MMLYFLNIVFARSAGKEWMFVLSRNYLRTMLNLAVAFIYFIVIKKSNQLEPKAQLTYNHHATEALNL